MADQSFQELKNRSLFARLKRLFSNDVIVRNIGGKKLKVVDTDEIQYASDKSSLRDRFNRLRSTSYDQHSRDFNISYQSNRMELFRDYDCMDMDPILSSALDIYADECGTRNEMGDIIQIKSSNDEVKNILHNLFYDILNVEFNLWSWTRSMVKYGDFYLKLHISPQYGVYLVEPLSSYYVTRLENTDQTNKNFVKFQVNSPTNNKMEDLENYQIAHFRLLNDSNFLPYGKCLVGETYVDTEFGSKYIKDLIIGEKVWSFNIKDGTFELTIVKNKINSGVKETIKITTQHNFIESSKNHPILIFCTDTNLMKYKQSSDIKIGDLLVINSTENSNISNIDNTTIVMNPVVSIEHTGERVMWDIQVESENSNFIANGILVHNSMLEGARRVWKQLSLMEDAMLIHRIMRSPEKRIFKVDIGNIPPNEVDNHMERIINQMKKAPFLDQNTGDYNLRFNLQNMVEDFFLPVRGGDSGTSIENLPGLEWTGTDDIEYLRNKLMAALKIPKAFLGYDESLSGKCVRGNTKISLIDGRELEIKDIADMFTDEISPNLEVYSYDSKTNSIIPGKIVECKKTRLNAELIRVHLDNNTSVDTTPDHGFVLRGGKKIEAKHLKSGDSLQAVYRRIEKFTHNDVECEQIYQPNTERWEWTHKMVDEYYSDTILDYEYINEPVNINPLTFNEHVTYNHKVVFVEVLQDRDDTYNLEVWDQNENHNYLISNGIVIKNSTLAAEDIRFARTIQRVQRIIISELNKIAVVHLYAQGYRDSSLVDFTLELTNPSTIFEKEKLDVWKTKVEVSKDMQEQKLFSKKWIYDKIFGVSDQEMIELQKQLVDDSKGLFRFKQIEEDGNDPALAFLKSNETGATSSELNPSTDSLPDTKSDEPKSDPSVEPPSKPTSTVPKLAERDQTGRKNVRDTEYHFGEDPTGRLELNSKYDLSPTHKYKNKSPLSFESFTGLSSLLKKYETDAVLLKEDAQKSYMDETNIKE